MRLRDRGRPRFFFANGGNSFPKTAGFSKAKFFEPTRERAGGISFRRGAGVRVWGKNVHTNEMGRDTETGQWAGYLGSGVRDDFVFPRAPHEGHGTGGGHRNCPWPQIKGPFPLVSGTKKGLGGGVRWRFHPQPPVVGWGETVGVWTRGGRPRLARRCWFEKKRKSEAPPGGPFRETQGTGNPPRARRETPQPGLSGGGEGGGGGGAASWGGRPRNQLFSRNPLSVKLGRTGEPGASGEETKGRGVLTAGAGTGAWCGDQYLQRKVVDSGPGPSGGASVPRVPTN